MAKTKRPTTRLRELLAQPGVVIAPGVADALNARLVAAEGFGAIYMTGGGTSAVRLGMPDVGLLTMPEMVDNAGRIADACGLPVISDADTGYGNPLNVQRTVIAYEKAGVAPAARRRFCTRMNFPDSASNWRSTLTLPSSRRFRPCGVSCANCVIKAPSAIWSRTWPHSPTGSISSAWTT